MLTLELLGGLAMIKTLVGKRGKRSLLRFAVTSRASSNVAASAPGQA
jgi:hypothetical protein